VKLPVDLAKIYSLISIDLGNFQAGHLAPGFRRIVAVLQVFGGEDEGCQKHSSAAHERTACRAVNRLLPREVCLRYEALDQNKVVEGNLKSTIARSRTAECLFNVCSQRQDATASATVTPAWYSGSGPYYLYHLSGRVFRQGIVSA